MLIALHPVAAAGQTAPLLRTSPAAAPLTGSRVDLLPVTDLTRMRPALERPAVEPARPAPAAPRAALPGSVTRRLDTMSFADPRPGVSVPNHLATIAPGTGATAGTGGLAAFVAPDARSYGAVSARVGRVALPRGDAVTVDLYGDRLIQLAVPGDSAVRAAAPDRPATGDASRPTGADAADARSLALSVGTARALVDGVVNMTGKAEARGIVVRDGRIVLVGDDPTGVPVAPSDRVGRGPATDGDAGDDTVTAPRGDRITRLGSWLASRRGQAAASMDTDSGRPARLIDLTPVSGLGLWVSSLDDLTGLAPAAGGGSEDPAQAMLRETCPDVALASMAWQSTPSEAAFNVAPEMVPYSADVFCGGYRVTSPARGSYSSYDVFTFVAFDFWTDLAQSRQARPVAETASLFGFGEQAVAAPRPATMAANREARPPQQIW